METKIVELVECDKCGMRDWKIYLVDKISQHGDGCYQDECGGKLKIYKRFEAEII